MGGCRLDLAALHRRCFIINWQHRIFRWVDLGQSACSSPMLAAKIGGASLSGSVATQSTQCRMLLDQRLFVNREQRHRMSEPFASRRLKHSVGYSS